MLTEQKLQSFKYIIQQSSRDEIIWMSGYLAGLSEKNAGSIAPPAQTEIISSQKSLLYLFYMERKQAIQKRYHQNLRLL